MYKLLIKLATLTIFSASSWASQHNYYIETDPSSFVFKGYSLNIFSKFYQLPNYRLGTAIFGFQFPDFFIDANPTNKAKNWKLRTKHGLDFYVDRTIAINDKTEWFIGLISVYFSNELSKKTTAETKSSFTQLSNGIRAGLIWYPLNNNFYINPWIAITHNRALSGSTRLENDQYDIQAVSPFATAHIGYQF
ncbi:MAG: hypothetical protein OEZ58_07455 [Gammaproteobacteria bacterium]|nr:hypothetical protein [Gammaproteobacteria bacterium]MDH5728812.1 hypothetical protein [Gammaproteobacteria bacterium]